MHRLGVRLRNHHLSKWLVVFFGHCKEECVGFAAQLNHKISMALHAQRDRTDPSVYLLDFSSDHNVYPRFPVRSIMRLCRMYNLRRQPEDSSYRYWQSECDLVERQEA